MINIGSAAKLYKDQKIEIGYYKASIINLNGFKYGKDICKQCNAEQKVFTLNPNKNPNPIWICIDCLNSIKIESFHCTKLGFVDLNLPKELKEEDARNAVKEESYLEMVKTPFYLTLQGEDWMCHCEDFMDYLGTWEAPDFTQESKNGNGKELFEEMTISGYHNLWSEFELADDETEHTWEDCLYHVFECRHCKIKQGYWEH